MTNLDISSLYPRSYSRMLTPLLSRFILLLLTISLLGCSKSKGDEPAPKDIVGRWDLQTQTIDYYNTDGSLKETGTIQYARMGMVISRVFMPDKRFEYRIHDDVQVAGTYTHTNKSVIFTFDNGLGSIPALTYAITQLTATELVLVDNKRTSGVLSYVITQNFTKR